MFQGAVTASSPHSSCRDTRTERNARTHRLSKIAARDAFVMSQKIAILRTDKSSGALLTALSRAGYEVRSRLEHTSPAGVENELSEVIAKGIGFHGCSR